VLVEAHNGDRIPGVIGADRIVHLECMIGPGAWRARVRHRTPGAAL